jgi:hypothetical protein
MKKSLSVTLVMSKLVMLQMKIWMWDGSRMISNLIVESGVYLIASAMFQAFRTFLPGMASQYLVRTARLSS